jgi:hypothetical protein
LNQLIAAKLRFSERIKLFIIRLSRKTEELPDAAINASQVAQSTDSTPGAFQCHWALIPEWAAALFMLNES